MQRLEKMTLKARHDIWLPMHAPQLRIANLDYHVGSNSGQESPLGSVHAYVWLRWTKLQQLTLGRSAFDASNQQTLVSLRGHTIKHHQL